MTPEDIESLSFRIIGEEAGDHGFDERHWSIVRRMIHTSADFEYLTTVRFHPEAVARGIAAIRAGGNVVCDTEMLRSGIRKAGLAAFGGQAICRIADPEIRDAAKSAGTTRAHAAVDAAVELMKDGIYAVGNAPTALLRLLDLVRTGAARPALIIGLPVGFVNAAESKAELVASGIPHISNQGRKGGSNVAASVVNALILMA